MERRPGHPHCGKNARRSDVGRSYYLRASALREQLMSRLRRRRVAAALAGHDGDTHVLKIGREIVLDLFGKIKTGNWLMGETRDVW